VSSAPEAGINVASAGGEDTMTPRPLEPTAQQLELLAQTIRDVVRFHDLSADETRDFTRWAQLGRPERQYDIFAHYRGRSSLRTYFIVVVQRMLLEWRNTKYPPVAGVRSGSSTRHEQEPNAPDRRE
jgi:hypothetical protein